jgi:hypothetical protein
LFDLIGSTLQGYISPLLTWMRGDLVGPALAGLILIFAVIVFIYLIVNNAADIYKLKRAQSLIYNKDQLAFAEKLNFINEEFQEIKKIDTAWAEFKETLILPKFDDQGIMIRPCENTDRPDVFFNQYDLRMGNDFARVLPSIFVGIGLSLTFLGLIAALSVAVTTIGTAADDPTSMRNAIGELLKVSSAKFYASLFALASSVVLTIVIRAGDSLINSQISKFNRNLEHCVRFITTESLSQATNNLLGEQLHQLKTFNTDLAMKIGKEVESSLNNTLGPVLKKLETLGDDLTENNIENLKQITTAVTDSITGSTSGAMERVAEVLDQVSGKLGGLTEILSGALSNFDTEFKTVLSGLQASLKQSTDQVANDIEGSMIGMKDGIEGTMVGMKDGIEGTMIGMKDGIEGTMVGMKDGIDTSASQIKEIIAEFEGTLTTLKDSGADIAKRSGEELSIQMTAAAGVASRQLSEAGEELSHRFKSSTEELVFALQSAGTQLNSFSNEFSEIPAKLSNVNAQLDTSAESIGNSAKQFSNASNGMQNLFEPLSSYAIETRKTVTEVSESLKNTSISISDSSQKMSKTVDILSIQIASQLEKLDGSDQNLAALLSSIESSTSKVLGEVHSYVQEIDSTFSSSLGILSEAISDFEEVASSTKSVVDKLNKR